MKSRRDAIGQFQIQAPVHINIRITVGIEMSDEEGPKLKAFHSPTAYSQGRTGRGVRLTPLASDSKLRRTVNLRRKRKGKRGKEKKREKEKEAKREKRG